MKALKTYLPLGVLVVVIAFTLTAGPDIAGRFAYAVSKGQNDAAREHLAELSTKDYMSPLFAEVAKVLKPAVVEVRVTKKVQMQGGPEMDEFMRRFFGEQGPIGPEAPNQPGQPNRPRPMPREFMQHGLGSGVIVDAKNGYVLTNYHVVANADQTQIVLADGRTLKAKWVRSDPQTDLAIVKVDGDDFIDAPLGDSDKMEIGQWVLAIGSPEGLPQTVTAGIISAKGRTTDSTSYQNFLQTDASINHGNSGGPLVNMRGEVIGINTAIVSETGVNEGIGMAIPSNMAKNIMAQLIDKGKVTRGFLGVAIQNVTVPLANSFKLESTKGALVSGVSPGGPADKAGLKEGDFITAIGGKAIADVNELRNLVATIEPGKEVPVEFYRAGKKMELKVKVDSQPANMMTTMGPTSAPGEASAEKLGLEVANLTKELANQYGYKSSPKGVIITDVRQGSPADEAGLRPGMVVTSVGGKDVSNTQEFSEAVSAKNVDKGVQMRVTTPAGGAMFVFLAVEGEK